MTSGVIFAGILVVYSMAKTIYLTSKKNKNMIISYDLSLLGEKERKEFSNFVTNLFSNLTFFYGLIVYLLDYYTKSGLLYGIIFIILTLIQDYYFIKKVFPNEYNKSKKRR